MGGEAIMLVAPDYFDSSNGFASTESASNASSTSARDTLWPLLATVLDMFYYIYEPATEDLMAATLAFYCWTELGALGSIVFCYLVLTLVACVVAVV